MFWTRSAQALETILCMVANLAVGQVTTRVSVDSNGIEGNRASDRHCSLSEDGRYVAFACLADNLVVGDSNGVLDVFVHDRATGRTERVSEGFGLRDGSGNRADANDWSEVPSLSADGRFVVFTSMASNLVTGDTNQSCDTFVHDRWTGTTTRVSVSSEGKEGDRGIYSFPAISADGRFIAFTSDSTNLVPGDFNGQPDVFLYDRVTRETVRVSIDSSGAESNGQSWVDGSCISAGGRFVIFTSGADNLVSNDTNKVPDVFVHDRETGETSRASVTSDEKQSTKWSADGVVSADGRYVAFGSGARLVPEDNFTGSDVYLRDRVLGITSRVSVDSSGNDPNGDSREPSMSSDGELISFQSVASDLVNGDKNFASDIFVRCRPKITTVRVSVNSDGTEGNRSSDFPAISADGRHVTFTSDATNLVPRDRNSFPDTFAHGPELTLSTDSSIAGVNERVTLMVYRGVPGHAASLWITRVDGSTIFVPLSLGAFGPDGLFTVSGQVPPGLHAEITLQCLAFDRDLEVAATNEVVVTLVPLEQR